MTESFLTSLKNIVPDLEKATDVSFCLLLTSFVLFADCASLYVNGMNILHLSEVPNVLKPRLAVEAVILVIWFGVLVGFVMPFIQRLANFVVSATVGRLWDYTEMWLGISDDQFRPPFDSVPILELSEKAHATKESYYLDLLKKANAEEADYLDKIGKTALFALTVLVLSCADLYAPLSPKGNGILAQIADGLSQSRYGLLFLLGAILLGAIVLVLAFYPVFENYKQWVYCPELAQELEEKRQEKREQAERFRREAEARKASRPPSVSDIGGRLKIRERHSSRLTVWVVNQSVRRQLNIAAAPSWYGKTGLAAAARDFTGAALGNRGRFQDHPK